MGIHTIFKYIATVPTVWDTTISLAGEIGKYVAIARKSGEDWYIGAMTNWDSRTIEIDFSFFEEGVYEVDIFEDGMNAHRVAKDYKRKIVDIRSGEKRKSKKRSHLNGWLSCLISFTSYMHCASSSGSQPKRPLFT